MNWDNAMRIPRRIAVNVIFLDGYAEHMPLPTPFQFKWNDG